MTITSDASATANPALDAARRALEDLSKRARTVIDTAHDAVVTIDAASTIIDWNATAERIFGWSRAEAVGRTLTDLIVPPQHRESHHRGLMRFLADGTPGILNQRVETTAVDRGGREFHIELSIWPMLSAGTYTFGSFIRDISDRKQAEEALKKSEEKYRAVVENANEGIIVSQDGLLKFVNPRGLTLIGRTLEEATNGPFIEMVHPDDRARVYGNYLRRMRGEKVENQYTFRVVTPLGESNWVEISAVAIQWEGRPATLNFLSDVGERIELQESLRDTLAEREAILQTTAVGVMLLREGHIRWINAALETAMMGYATGEMIGKTGEVAFHDQADWSHFLKQAIPALECDGAFEIEWQLARKDGSAWWCHVSATAFKPSDLGAGTIWFFLDISARKRAEEEVRRALLRARELSDLKTRFVSVASHEFRTPLATILSSVELIEDFGPELPDTERRELVKMIRGAIGRMNSMIEQVLLIGKAEADNLEFEPAPMDPIAFATSLAREVERSQGGRAKIAFSPRGPGGMRGLDANLLTHVVSNLLANAVKYSPAGSTVDFELECAPASLTFLVRDRGIGIPPEDHARLFESFHRARNVGNIEGTGLGLTIVKHCIELHGGTVDFESAPGTGSTFIVCVPAPAA